MIKRLLLTIISSILIIISFSLMIYSNLLNEKFILLELEEMNYYDYIYDEIINKLDSELPNKDLAYVYDKYVTKEKIREDIKVILDNYRSKENNKIKDEFYNNVIKNLGAKNDDNIKELSSNLANTYFNNLFRIDRLNKVINKLTISRALKAMTFTLIFVLIFFIGFSLKKVYLYNSFIVSGSIFLLPKIFIMIKDIIENLYYYNNGLSYFIRMYICSIIDIYFMIGLILIVIGVIGLSFFCFGNNKRQLTKNVE